MECHKCKKLIGGFDRIWITRLPIGEGFDVLYWHYSCYEEHVKNKEGE